MDPGALFIMYGKMAVFWDVLISMKIPPFNHRCLSGVYNLWFNIQTFKLNSASAVENDSIRNSPNMHYGDVIMGAMASQITSLTIVYSTVYSDADQRKHQNSASLAFVRGIHRGPVNSPHKWPVTQKIFPFDDVIMAHQDICLHYITATIVSALWELEQYSETTWWCAQTLYLSGQCSTFCRYASQPW